MAHLVNISNLRLFRFLKGTGLKFGSFEPKDIIGVTAAYAATLVFVGTNTPPAGIPGRTFRNGEKVCYFKGVDSMARDCVFSNPLFNNLQSAFFRLYFPARIDWRTFMESAPGLKCHVKFNGCHDPGRGLQSLFQASNFSNHRIMYPPFTMTRTQSWDK